MWGGGLSLLEVGSVWCSVVPVCLAGFGALPCRPIRQGLISLYGFDGATSSIWGAETYIFMRLARRGLSGTSSGAGTAWGRSYRLQALARRWRCRVCARYASAWRAQAAQCGGGRGSDALCFAGLCVVPVRHGWLAGWLAASGKGSLPYGTGITGQEYARRLLYFCNCVSGFYTKQGKTRKIGA